MKLPGIFELTKGEQRAVTLIVMAILAAALARYYRNDQSLVAPATSASTSKTTTVSPSPAPPEDEPGD